MKKAFVAILGIAGILTIGLLAGLSCQKEDATPPQITRFEIAAIDGSGPSYVWADSVKGSVAVIVEASDNVGVDKCVFYINDTIVDMPLAVPQDTTSSVRTYIWDTKLMQDSVRYTINLRVYDAAGNEATGTAKSYIVRVPNTPPDTAKILSPKDGATLLACFATFQWQGSDPDTLPAQTEDLVYDVYFGKTSNPSKVTEQPISHRDTVTWGTGQLNEGKYYLEPETDYYWKVVTIDKYKKQTPTKVIKFSRGQNQLPGFGTPSSPPAPDSVNSVIKRPADNKAQLRWTIGEPDQDPLTYDLYFGPHPSPDDTGLVYVSALPKIASALGNNSYTVQFSADTLYLWRAVAKDIWGGTRNPDSLKCWTITLR